MTQITASQAVQQRPAVSHVETSERPISGLIVLIVLVSVGLFALFSDRPPRPMNGSTPAGQFSAERALKHVFAISKIPHPVGSAEHARVRDYIVSALARAGLNAEVQTATAVNQKLGAAASVENIVARLHGTGAGKAVLLVAHYDSVPRSFGASDDGAGVATLLETARAMKALPQPKRDIIFLFTDGEEVGLLGAEGFVAQGRQAENAGIVLNFEARGTSGPAILFETSNRNGSLIRAFGQAVPHPVANSLSYEIYKRLPNDTDFSVFKRAGYPGLNFAFIEGLVHYHTARDIYSNLDPGSLQQEGDYALHLATWFGNAGEDDLKEGNVVYFDVLGLVLVRYSSIIEMLLIALAAILLAVLVVQGHRKHWADFKAILLGMLVIGAAFVTAVAGGFAADWLLETLAGGWARVSAGELYNTGLYVTALSVFGLAAASFVLVGGGRRIGSRNIALAGLGVWFLLLLLTSILMPGAGYIWLWPLLFILAAWNVIAAGNIRRGSVLLTAAAVPGVVLIAPMMHKIFTAFSMGSYPIVSVMMVLLVALYVDQLALARMPRLWAMPVGLFAVGAGVTIAALLLSPHFDRNHPRFDSVFYGEDADSGKAFWASYDNRPDTWTSQFLSADAHKATLDKFIPGSPRKFLQSAAQVLPLHAPEIQIMENKAMAGGRQVRVRVTSPRHAPILSIFSRQDAVVKASVNGKELTGRRTARGYWTMQYYAVPAGGIELVLDLKGANPVHFQIADISYGLPDGAISGFKARPDNVISLPGRLSNKTIVTKSFGL